MSYVLEFCFSSYIELFFEFSLVYSIYNSMLVVIVIVLVEKQVYFLGQLEEFKKNFWEYIGYILRIKY